ncbi:MAG: glycerol-3-phosphate 1-O-acyltransferase PlsY [Coraliomargaritaceae bacterium]
MNPLEGLSVVVIGYLIGSVSFSVIIARHLGVNIFAVGSGNPGATNVKRVLGAKWGNTVFILDAWKGLVAAGWPLLFFDGGEIKLAILGLLASLAGHSYSVFLKFRGGKGVATTMGGLLAIMPVALFVGLLVWLAIYYASRVVALASILFALSLPISSAWLYSSADSRFIFGCVLCLLIIFRHKSNISRLLQGKENSFKQ